jgi:hypothetical protein
MGTFPNSPCVLMGGIVSIDLAPAAAQSGDAPQYNSDSLSSTLRAQTEVERT